MVDATTDSNTNTQTLSGRVNSSNNSSDNMAKASDIAFATRPTKSGHAAPGG